MSTASRTEGSRTLKGGLGGKESELSVSRPLELELLVSSDVLE